MPQQAPEPTPTPTKLTTQQRRFVEEYCVDWNGTQAAIRAGYSAKTARSISSENLTKPDIRAAIDARLKELSLSAGQTTKLISEIAETSLNEFIIIRQVPARQRVEAYANVVLDQVREEIALYQQKLGSLDPKAAEPLNKAIGVLRTREVELEVYVQRYGPTALLQVQGPEVLEERAEFDLVALARAKRAGRIKSWTPTEFGIKVELYDAAAALRDMGRVHGIFEKDNDQSKAVAVLQAQVTLVPAVGGIPVATSEKEVRDV